MDFVIVRFFFKVIISLKVHLQWDKETLWLFIFDMSSFPVPKDSALYVTHILKLYFIHTRTHTHTNLMNDLSACVH